MASKLCPFCMKTTNQETCPHCGKQTNYAGQPLHLPAGYVVSGRHPYVLGAALGQGGFGITYIALDMVTGQRVAIKEYFPTHCSGRTGNNGVTAYQNQAEIFRKGRERFLDEAKTLKSLSDLKSIVNVLDYFEANNSAYLVMEYLEGISLKDYAARKGKFPARKFLSQIKPLMEDIQRMHERGVIHRDIAPDNIILMPNGQMKLIDFGAARSYISGKSMTMVVKKGFAPVEQYLSHGSTASTDVYALAATIYYCITGRVPPDSADREYAGTALTSPNSLGADLTPQQEKAILKALKVQQKERTQSVKAFLADLHKKRALILFPNPRSRKLLLLILAVLASILILIGTFFLLSDKEPVREDSVPGNHASEAGSPAPEQDDQETADTSPTPPPEREASGKASSDKPSSGGGSSSSSSNSGSSSSNKPSSGGSSSGGSSSGGSSSGGSSADPTVSTGSGNTGGNNSGSDNDWGGGITSDGGNTGDSPSDSGSADSETSNSGNTGSGSGSGTTGSGSSDSGSSDSGSADTGSSGGFSGGGSSGSGASGGGSSDSGFPNFGGIGGSSSGDGSFSGGGSFGSIDN